MCLFVRVSYRAFKNHQTNVDWLFRSVFSAETDSDTAKKDLLAELELLKLIEPHPNVIGLLGCCTRTGKVRCS